MCCSIATPPSKSSVAIACRAERLYLPCCPLRSPLLKRFLPVGLRSGRFVEFGRFIEFGRLIEHVIEHDIEHGRADAESSRIGSSAGKIAQGHVHSAIAF